MCVSRATQVNVPHFGQEGDIDFYQDNGYVRLQNVFSGRLLQTFSKLITDAVRAANVRSLEDDDDYAKAFTQVMNLWENDPVVRSFVFSKKLAAISARLLQVKGVRIYHDQALYKEPGGGCTPWHADGYYFPLSTAKILTAWVPLQAVPRSMGPLEFAAKSQQDDIGRSLGISGESERKIQESVRSAGYHLASSAFELGEVSFHSGWTFHRADGNSTDQPRKVMTAIYMDEDIRMIEPQHSNHRADHERWLPGVKPGEVAASFRNPIVYSSA
ncbi:hypothetical protein WJX73_010597 [Symbiochloris irregularis]|uniref:Phytanoyl-CoA dioxygenase n=1 Tax=Symbiochloris irregularis TaxID=706552 RepID=A0AAW1PRG5_9CHLO